MVENKANNSLINLAKLSVFSLCDVHHFFFVKNLLSDLFNGHTCCPLVLINFFPILVFYGERVACLVQHVMDVLSRCMHLLQLISLNMVLYRAERLHRVPQRRVNYADRATLHPPRTVEPGDLITLAILHDAVFVGNRVLAVVPSYSLYWHTFVPDALDKRLTLKITEDFIKSRVDLGS